MKGRQGGRWRQQVSQLNASLVVCKGVEKRNLASGTNAVMRQKKVQGREGRDRLCSSGPALDNDPQVEEGMTWGRSLRRG